MEYIKLENSMPGNLEVAIFLREFGIKTLKDLCSLNGIDLTILSIIYSNRLDCCLKKVKVKHNNLCNKNTGLFIDTLFKTVHNNGCIFLFEERNSFLRLDIENVIEEQLLVKKLKQNGIFTIGHLILRGGESLKYIHGIGPNTVSSIYFSVHKAGYYFIDEDNSLFDDYIEVANFYNDDINSYVKVKKLLDKTNLIKNNLSAIKNDGFEAAVFNSMFGNKVLVRRKKSGKTIKVRR